MEYQNIQVEIAEGIAVVTISRRQALNALNTATLRELENIFDEIAGSEIKAVIITGAGEKAFIAGADIAEMAGMSPLEAREFALLGHRVTRKMERIPQPVIAAVNGFALGGGCEIALACDIRIAAEGARFGQPEVGLGIIPGFGGTQRLPRLIGKGLANELLLTARLVTSGEALQMGLVNQVVSSDQLMTKAREMAKTIGEKGSIAARLIKTVVLRGQGMDLEKALEMEADSFALCFSTGEQKEGMEAFLSKRKPAFKGA